MNALWKVDKVLYDFETKHICTTSDTEELIKVCNQMKDEDFNVTLFVNGNFIEIYRDLEEKEIVDILNEFKDHGR